MNDGLKIDWQNLSVAIKKVLIQIGLVFEENEKQEIQDAMIIRLVSTAQTTLREIIVEQTNAELKIHLDGEFQKPSKTPKTLAQLLAELFKVLDRFDQTYMEATVTKLHLNQEIEI